MIEKGTSAISEVLDELYKEKINTWFDLGLFLDRFKEKKKQVAFNGEKEEFDRYLEKGG